MNEITQINLNDKEIVQGVKEVMDSIILYDDIDGAENLYNNLEKMLVTQTSSLDDQVSGFYRQVIDKSKLIAITTLDNSEVVDLFNRYIRFLLINENIDVWNKLLSKLRSILILEERDQLKNNIKNDLLANENVLTSAYIQKEEKNLVGSAANWLEYYISQVGNTSISNVRFQEFINQDKNIERLKADEKRMVQELLGLYEKLKYSSFSYEGIEDYIYIDDGKRQGWVRLGKFIPDKKNPTIEKRISEAENILKKALSEDYYKYFPGEAISSSTESTQANNENVLLKNYDLKILDWQKIKAEMEKIKDKGLGGAFSKYFHQALNDKDNIKITAALRLLAKQGKLDEIFELDKKIKEIFTKHLQKKFGDKISTHFEKNLRAPVYLSYFLQHVFKDILSLNENESAVLAIRLVNELKRAGDKQYIAIAYGDLNDGKFKWKTILEKEGSLDLDGS